MTDAAPSAPRSQAVRALSAGASVELRHLRYFEAVARELHFTRAAQKLHLTQQALSTSVRQLEDQLEVRLFDRTAKGVELTSAGHELLSSAPQVLDHVQEVCRRVSEAGRSTDHLPRFGHSDIAGTSLVPELFASVRRRHGTVGCTARQMATEEVLTGLRRQRLDVAVLVSPGFEHTDGLRERVLRSEPISALIGNRHPLIERESVGFGELTDHVLHRVPRLGFHDAVEAIFRARALEPRLIEEPLLTDAAWIGSQFVESDCLTLVPEYVATQLSPWGVAHRPVSDAPSLEVVALWREADQTAGVLRFRRELSEAAEELDWSPVAQTAHGNALDAAA